MIERLGASQNPLKKAGAWLAEKAARVKLGGTDEPGDLSRLEVLETSDHGHSRQAGALAGAASRGPALRGAARARLRSSRAPSDRAARGGRGDAAGGGEGGALRPAKSPNAAASRSRLSTRLGPGRLKSRTPVHRHGSARCGRRVASRTRVPPEQLQLLSAAGLVEAAARQHQHFRAPRCQLFPCHDAAPLAGPAQGRRVLLPARPARDSSGRRRSADRPTRRKPPAGGRAACAARAFTALDSAPKPAN